MSGSWPTFRFSRSPALLPVFCLGVIQIVNPLSNSPFFGPLGIEIYSLHVPLMFLGYNFIERDKDLRKFLTFNAVLVTCVAGLGIAQSILGPKFLRNWPDKRHWRKLDTTSLCNPGRLECA